MDVERLALVQGLRDTRQSLSRWNDDPGSVLRPWLAGALAIATGLLLAVWAIAALSTADPTITLLPGLNLPADGGGARRGSCFATRSCCCCTRWPAWPGSSRAPRCRSRPNTRPASRAGSTSKAGPFAIAFVGAATLFSLVTQAFVLGGVASDLAGQLDISTGVLLLTLLPHALPELTALFLPLAAWLVASRRDDWDELLAATFVTVAIAVPMLVVTALHRDLRLAGPAARGLAGAVSRPCP